MEHFYILIRLATSIMGRQTLSHNLAKRFEQRSHRRAALWCRFALHCVALHNRIEVLRLHTMWPNRRAKNNKLSVCSNRVRTSGAFDRIRERAHTQLPLFIPLHACYNMLRTTSDCVGAAHVIVDAAGPDASLAHARTTKKRNILITTV